MPPDFPITADIVLVGGGHTHALVLKAWAMSPLPGARLTLITPTPTTAYSGMLPGHIAGHYTVGDLQIDLVQLARFAGARIILAPATGIDPTAKTIAVRGRGPVGYDILSIDIGVNSLMPELPGFAEFGTAAKPLDQFASKWSDFITSGGGAVAIIGGGIAGVELAMAARHRLGPGPSVTLIDRGEILSASHSKARDLLRSELAGHNIACCAGAEVLRLTAKGVELADDETIPAQFTIGAAGARPYDWLRETGMPHENGYLTVTPTLQCPEYPDIFAAGDCAHLAHDPRPKAGVFAVRAAPFLTTNLHASARGRPEHFKEFQPQKDYLKLVSLGGKRALAERDGRVFSGAAMWRLKDYIDQKFMRKFKGLAPMEAPNLPTAHAAGLLHELNSKPLCGGCGAKLGPAALSDVLATLPATPRSDILSEPGDDAAILRTGGTTQILTTDHLRGFTADPGLMARITATHALGDCWAMGAAPQAATATVILPRLSGLLQSRWLSEIMAEAGAVFVKAGANIVGGHSSMGAELTIGFTITGLLNNSPVTIAGAKSGDHLILTKPLGSGVILAAEMQLAAPGAVVAGAWDIMQEGQGAAAEILAPLANAMTDVTGFGLAGHLMNICDASDVAAEVDLEALPALPGALELLRKGHYSSLAPANITALQTRCDFGSSVLAQLAFDPQTAGGLLAAIPAEQSQDLLAALSNAGVNAANIGKITNGPPRLVRV